MTSLQARPWYREPWPWVLLAIPVATIVAGAITMLIALRGADGVVAEDYYKRGLEIGVEASRQERARTLGLRADVQWEGLAAGDAIRVTLLGETSGAGATLRLRLIHPAHSSADRVALLSRQRRDDGTVSYVGAWSPAQDTSVPRAGRVVLETEQWRIDGDWRGDASVALKAQ
jgi:hypothetical protein